MKYKVLLFDADETLFDFNYSEYNSIKQSLLHFDLTFDENIHIPLYHKINHDIWKDFEKGLITQNSLKTERFSKFLKNLDINVDYNNFSNVYMDYLGQSSFLFPESISIIERLSKTHRLAIITNGLTVVQENRISKSIIAPYFEQIIISESINMSKPNAGIFKYTLEQMNFDDKSSVLMIGDSLTSDIEGGLNFGIDTCWYNPKKLKNTLNLTPTYEINTLESIFDII